MIPCVSRFLYDYSQSHVYFSDVLIYLVPSTGLGSWGHRQHLNICHREAPPSNPSKRISNSSKKNKK